MKRKMILLACVLYAAAAVLTGCGSGVGVIENKDVITDPEVIRVMSFNICGWNYKKIQNLAPRVILEYSPDLLGVQECTYDWYKKLTKELPDYGFIGVGRENGELNSACGEISGILYRTDRFTLLENGTFWLSETPDVPSCGWDADYIRVCTWAVLKRSDTGEEVAFLNTHLENIDDGTGALALENGAKMVAQKALSFDIPVIMAGDWNFEKFTKYYEIMTSAGFRDAQDVAQDTMEGNTFHGYDASEPEEHVDYIFVSDGVSPVLTYKIVRDIYGGAYPSDHYPIYADLKF